MNLNWNPRSHWLLVNRETAPIRRRSNNSQAVINGSKVTTLNHDLLPRILFAYSNSTRGAVHDGVWPVPRNNEALTGALVVRVGILPVIIGAGRGAGTVSECGTGGSWFGGGLIACNPGTLTGIPNFRAALWSESGVFCLAMTGLSLPTVRFNFARNSLHFSIRIILVNSWYAVNNSDPSTLEIACPTS
jgi:hypothetical protein